MGGTRDMRGSIHHHQFDLSWSGSMDFCGDPKILALIVDLIRRLLYHFYKDHGMRKTDESKQTA